MDRILGTPVGTGRDVTLGQLSYPVGIRKKWSGLVEPLFGGIRLVDENHQANFVPRIQKFCACEPAVHGAVIRIPQSMAR